MKSLRLPTPRPQHATLRVPGDKSISHRILMLAAIAQGRTRIHGANEGDDVAATMRALRALGVQVMASGNVITVEGTRSLRQPRATLDCGNSGTAMRLLMGLVAGRVYAVLDGDRSLRRRPMERVAAPLRSMGADIATAPGGTPPVTVHESPSGLRGIRYRLPVASAQLKSALLIAGLRAQGATVLRAATSSRDHTERLMRFMGARIAADKDVITLQPGRLRALRDFRVPGDLSAAFYL
ncbi:MAG: 3-phosphoshikimate 1-carboxyvinyltransferase, partial [Candidatus Eremiobacteraeota bacterium]|nr:3-phosphoshikimate 1-carboxyvinyltransferase [Candidatus Eremiobacteraeota bacterium]